MVLICTDLFLKVTDEEGSRSFKVTKQVGWDVPGELSIDY